VKGIRFYEEYHDSKKTESAGNVVAVETAYKRVANVGTHVETVYDAYAAVFARPNSPVATTGAAQSYLRECCKQVSESRAREVHPRLFEFLDAEC
jgi:hypothetical protein